jgi:hypothetical protein
MGAAAIEAITVVEDSEDWAETELLSVGKAAERVGIARTSLDNWHRAHNVIDFRKGVHNFVYPTMPPGIG